MHQKSSLDKAFLFGLLLAAGIVLATTAWAEDPAIERSERHDFEIVTLANGFDHPWGLAFLPNGDMLVTERSGTLRLVSERLLEPQAVDGIPEVADRGQGGLLDIALHPDFANNGLIYLSYSGRGDGGASTEVVRGRLDGTALQDAEVIFRAVPKTSGSAHFGSRLLFAPDGTLYVSLGDRRNVDQSQDPGNHIGTVVRLNDDGSIPEGNPLIGRSDALPEVYSYGHRNVQGLALRPGTEQIWSHEHGPRGGDEVNILQPGANYGWPVITYGVAYSGLSITDKTHMEGMEQPVIYWDPSIAPSGMAFYDGTEFPEWRDNIFVGALAHQHLRRLELNGDEVVAQEVLLEDFGERIRDVRSGPDGFIYLLTDSSNGKLLRLEPLDG